MDISLRQDQRLVQRLALTPQMQLSLKLLQLNTLELEQLLEKELQQNPFLEVEEKNGSTETSNNPQPPVVIMEEESKTEAEYKHRPEPEEVPTSPFARIDLDWDDHYHGGDTRVFSAKEDVDQPDFSQFVAAPESLFEHLKYQLQLSPLEGKDREIGLHLIGNIDGDGYLRINIEEVAQQLDTSAARVENVLKTIQDFEPPGVAARDIRESLLLQAKAFGLYNPLLEKIINGNLDKLSKQKFDEIAKELGIKKQSVHEAFRTISHLDPRPGRNFTKASSQYVMPDVTVKKVDDKWLVFLNEGKTGYLRVNSYYRDLLKDEKFSSKEERQFALDRYRKALWWIRNIERRKNTLLRVAEAIVNFQKDFLEQGMEHLRPLTLKEVAETVDLHEATVARITTGKYMDTPRGMFELKFFFSSGIDREGGEATSSTSVKHIIQQIVVNETPGQPYSDQQIVHTLKERGINIARRTVAKYREQMKILPARLRRNQLPK